MTTMEPEQQAVTECKLCGQMFAYEPIWICGKDFGRTLHLHCTGCEARALREAGRVKAEARQAEREASIVAQIPPDLLATDVTRADFKRGLWEIVRQWGPAGDFWLGIIGGAGLCKTRCMALLAARVMRDGGRVVWTTANRIKDASADRGHRERGVSLLAREHLEDCLHAGWLFVDDIGKNEWGPAFESQFFKILDHRKNYRLPVVFSSNAHPSALSQMITPLNAGPIIGRLLDRTTLLDLM